MFQKSGGLFPPATGLKPCSVGSRSHNAIGNCNPVIKATKNGGSHPTVSFTPALVLMTKEKILSKAGGQRYLAIKGHARPMFNLLYLSTFRPHELLCCRGRNRTFYSSLVGSRQFPCGR